MPSIRSIGTLASLLLCTSSAEAGNQLFEASWSVKAFGNELTTGTGASQFYSARGIPLGIQCHPNQPRCPFDSTPTDGAGNFAPLGGNQTYAMYCAPWYDFGGKGTAARPAKGATAKTSGAGERLIPPLYRNPEFFTSGGQPNATSCTATSTGATPGGKGRVQAGRPVTGTWTATTTGTGRGGFNIAPAPQDHAFGVRATGIVGDVWAIYPYIYSYTYATLRNDAGAFGPGQGPGSFSIPYKLGANTVAKVVVKQGAAKFGGTMRMLGKITTKGCYYRNGGCLLSSLSWRYDAVGAAAYTSGGVVTLGYQAYSEDAYPPYCYHCYGCTNPFCCDCFTPARMRGSRFPWTTGSVTVTATGRGPHKTVHCAKGYDNRTPTSGRGTIQLVSPTLTTWLQPAVNFETGGVAILRIRFIPEPRTLLMLVAGICGLGVFYRWRV